MNNSDLEDIIYNDYFKDYNKDEIYKLLNQLSNKQYNTKGELIKFKIIM